ncbi:hypothetical protein K437DRAFT_255012 [Tilletiaria anomala UBC 951]|uniref:Uncharacterized protein n=1 Tax=Tilletiaria anomala (strain ATCC 24038 / CBS 436.72 / UBC 951) TaxID=1037660 RepID=A0A066WA98_TILAU|nr:uncharacterized protein K437DRAFT_255012 [Tilletiaria anomala UBC 951]KDN50842.1 hypothetical protein K437DRAFT_255012 [Tilletiaria anomala UBC 951]
MLNSFSKSDKNADVATEAGIEAEQPAALSAFLSPTSRFFGKKADPKLLGPNEIAQKVASILKPGKPFFSAIDNASLIANLGNGSIMNCDALRAQAQAKSEKKRKAAAKSKDAAAIANVAEDATAHQDENEDGTEYVGTVWSALNSLPVGAGWSAIPGSEGQPLSITSDGPADNGLWTSMMVTCDLNCTKLQLGKSVVIPSKVLEDNHYFTGNPNSLYTSIGAGTKYHWDNFEPAPLTGSFGSSFFPYAAPSFSPALEMWSWPSWVPFLGKKDGSKSGDDSSKTPKSSTPSAGTDTNGNKRVWLPSTTDVSVHCTWWGFTCYLPTPVMNELSGDVQQAEKIANLISSVLTFISNNVPAGVPVALLPFIAVLKAIAPISGYISTFIGWSWSEIKSFDEGHGVELSATWLLPVALIPHRWAAPVPPVDADPTSPTPAPAPAPATPATSTPSTSEPAPAEPMPVEPEAEEPTPSERQPEEPTVNKSTLDESTPVESKPEESTPYGSTPDESKPEDPTPDQSMPDESTLDESQTDESTLDESQTDESTSAVMGSAPAKDVK